MDAAIAETGPGRGKTALMVITRFVPGFVAIAALLFLPAGSLGWTKGWIYLCVLVALMIAVLSYFLLRDPALLRKRMQVRERRSAQKLCVSLSFPMILATFVIPGLDWRFGWSSMPAALAWIGLGLAVAGYVLFFAVLRHNSYASRLIEVQEGQRVVDTGPYSVLRHPMYAASFTIYLGTPLALGSWWALIPALAYLPLLMLRVRDEEALLLKELPGYAEYCARKRWRILPGIW
jgi:protein-S-isoprenylcysteine O-methyltransferase Ste14